VERLSRREAEAREALRLSRFRGERKTFAATLDGWVRTGALTPEARDKALAAVDAQQSGYGHDAESATAADGGSSAGAAPEFVFRAGLVRELLETMARPRPFGREAATAAPLGALARQAALPAADSLSREASKLAATGRFTLAQAQAHVLAQDSDLAARWLAEVNHTLPTGGQ
jgi:hypothetical protein